MGRSRERDAQASSAVSEKWKTDDKRSQREKLLKRTLWLQDGAMRGYERIMLGFLDFKSLVRRLGVRFYGFLSNGFDPLEWAKPVIVCFLI